MTSGRLTLCLVSDERITGAVKLQQHQVHHKKARFDKCDTSTFIFIPVLLHCSLVGWLIGLKMPLTQCATRQPACEALRRLHARRRLPQQADRIKSAVGMHAFVFSPSFLFKRLLLHPFTQNKRYLWIHHRINLLSFVLCQIDPSSSVAVYS